MSYKSPFQLAYYRFGLGNGSLCSYWCGEGKMNRAPTEIQDCFLFVKAAAYMKKTWQQKLMMVKCQIFKNWLAFSCYNTYVPRFENIYFKWNFVLPTYLFLARGQQGYFGGHRDKILKRWSLLRGFGNITNQFQCSNEIGLR